MIQLEEAYEIVMNSAFLTGIETVPFTETMNRVLAENIVSDIDLPPFNKSNVDGYACRREDLNHELQLIETIPAGKVPDCRITPDKCSKIMTGAPVPPGADHVFMVEDAKILESGRVKCTRPSDKDNISRKGEDIKQGAVVLEPGIMIRPQDVAVMAATGSVNIAVRKKPLVAVISSGSELTEPDMKPGPAQIRNSNAYQLMVQIRRAGGEEKYYGIAPDDEKKTQEIIEKALSGTDIVLITGGVSMGDFDFIPAVLERLGVNILFSKVAVQPGKPTLFGTHQTSLVFGLPGNPVSSFMQFEMLIRPLISKMMDYQWQPMDVIFPMKDRYSRKSSDRMALLPVVFTDDGYVAPVDYHGSAHIAALSVADGIIALPIGVQTIQKGEQVSVRQI